MSDTQTSNGISDQKKENKKRKMVRLDIDLNAILTGFNSAKIATPQHHKIMNYYASPLLLGPSPSDELLELVMHMYTEDEADIVQYLRPLRPLSLESLSKESGRSISDVKLVIDNLAFNKFVILATGKPRKYSIIPILPGTFEMALMTADIKTRNSWHKTFAEIIEKLWDKGDLVSTFKNTLISTPPVRYLPITSVGRTLTAAWPSDHFEELIDPYNLFAVGTCQCRLAMQLVGKGCNKPLENCTSFGPGAKPLIQRGLMREVSRKEILAIKQDAEDHGLVSFMINHFGNKDGNGSCSCCGCCCHVLRGIKEFNVPGMVCKPHFMPVHDATKCTNCNMCVIKCPMDAWKNENGRLEFSPIRCIGCGLCVSSCKFDALSLKPLADAVPPESSMNMLLLKIFPSYLFNSVKVWASRLFPY